MKLLPPRIQFKYLLSVMLGLVAGLVVSLRPWGSPNRLPRPQIPQMDEKFAVNRGYKSLAEVQRMDKIFARAAASKMRLKVLSVEETGLLHRCLASKSDARWDAFDVVTFLDDPKLQKDFLTEARRFVKSDSFNHSVQELVPRWLDRGGEESVSKLALDPDPFVASLIKARRDRYVSALKSTSTGVKG